MSKQEKARSRARIVAAAARRFRARGIAGTVVGDVMADAGLTHGGFYRHFGSKEELAVAALQSAFDEFVGPLADAVASGPSAPALTTFVERYLSSDHVHAPQAGCPVPALAAEVTREAPAVRAAFEAGVAQVLATLDAADATRAGSRQRAIRRFALLVGAVVLARGVTPPLAAEILDACRSPD